MAEIVTRYITKNPYFNDGKWITGDSFDGFFLHSVGVGQPDPMVFITRWDSAGYTNAGVNGFIGADKIYITAPCLETPGKVKRMPHGGKQTSNNRYIGFEMCEPSQVHYTGNGASFTVSDLQAARAFVKKTYDNAVELFALLCKFHGKDPRKRGVIYSHNEGGKIGIAAGHVDPEHLWRGLGMPYTMDGFRQDVYNKMQEEDNTVAINMTKAELEKLIDDRAKEKCQELLAGRETVASNWAREELAEAVAMGITDGSRPQGYAKREEVAAMVLRAKKLK